jgi:AcrR family transcriptional regulator
MKDRRNEILEAATSCFSRFGYDKTTLDDIGNAVGINKVSLYHYFKNKESLFAEALMRESAAFAERMMRKVEGVEGAKAKILALIEEGFERGRGADLAGRLSVETLRSLSPLLLELRAGALRGGEDYLAAIVAGGQERGEFLPCDARRVARSIQGVIYSLRDAAYMRSKTGLKDEAEAAALLGETVFTVSLILDGIARGR